MVESKNIADQFVQIQMQLGSSEPDHLKDALGRLSIMLQVLDCFEGTQSHRLVEN